MKTLAVPGINPLDRNSRALPDQAAPAGLMPGSSPQVASRSSLQAARASEAEPLVFDLDPDRQTAMVEIVIPVYNEQGELESSISRLCAYLTESFPLSWLITIADNASIDDTWRIACRLAQRHDNVRAVHLDMKGRGRALRSVWSRSTSPVVAYMDVDLSTDLGALLPLIAPLVTGHSDLAIGSRLAASSRVARGPKREAISRTYNMILKATLHAGFSDAQCGFKAGRTEAVKALLVLVEDQGWFFDTELLVLAEHNGLRIHEVPVDWVDDPDSRVHVASTAKDDLKGVWRLIRSFAKGRGDLPQQFRARTAVPERPTGEQLVRFASIGVVSTVAFAGLFALAASPLGTLAADVIALGACTVANTAANRRLTFAMHGRAGATRHQMRGLLVAVAPLAVNLTTFAVLSAVGVSSLVAVTAALTLATASAGLLRFRLLERWVFARRPTDIPAAATFHELTGDDHVEPSR